MPTLVTNVINKESWSSMEAEMSQRITYSLDVTIGVKNTLYILYSR